MASPDVAGYLGLELVDLDEQTLIDSALEDALTKLPEWTPREGNTEVVLLEALAVEAAETIYAANRIPDGLTEVLLRLYGVERDTGAAPSASVEFTVAASSVGYTIPAGTVIRVPLGEDLDPVDLATVADLTIPAGSTTGTVTAVGDTVTVDANGQPAGTRLELLDAVPYVDSVRLATAVTGGRLAEDATSYLDRAAARLARLTTTLVRPADVAAYVAEDPAVTRVTVLDLYNPALGSGEPGDHPGYVAVAVATAGGGPLDAAAKDALEAELTGRMHAGLIVTVVDADVTPVDVTITVLRRPGYDDATVAANVTAILRTYLDPDTWEWSPVVRRNELIAQADRADGVDTVLDVTLPTTDLVLPGVAPLAAAGTITVTVQAPA